MARILMLVCIITMMSLAQTQKDIYNQQEYQAENPINSKESPQSRSLANTNQPTTDNLSPRNNEAIRRSGNIQQESTSLENGALEDSTGNDNDRAVFPGPTSSPNRNRRSVLDICKTQGYCEKAPNYPNEIAKKIVDAIGDRSDFFQMDVLDIKANETSKMGVSLCKSNTTIYHPQLTHDRDGKQHFIVNPNDKKVQGFQVELCENGNTSCHSILSLPVNYISTCTQKYIYRTMKAFIGNTTYTVKGKLPIRCTCNLFTP